MRLPVIWDEKSSGPMIPAEKSVQHKGREVEMPTYWLCFDVPIANLDRVIMKHPDYQSFPRSDVFHHMTEKKYEEAGLRCVMLFALVCCECRIDAAISLQHETLALPLLNAADSRESKR